MLRTRVLGEADLIVSLFAERHGLVRGVARSARRSRRRFGGALEPLTRVRAAWTERDGRDLQRIDALDTVRSFASMQAEPACQAACAVLCEVSESFTHAGQPEEKAFKLLGAVLEALDAGLEPAVALRYHELWTLRIHGLMPELDRCALCGERLAGRGSARASRQHGLLCGRCHPAAPEPALRWGSAERAFLDSARRLPPGELSGSGAAVRPGGALEALLRGRLEAFAERSFRSYRHFAALASSRREGGR